MRKKSLIFSGGMETMNSTFKICWNANHMRFVLVLMTTFLMAIGCGGSDNDSSSDSSNTSRSLTTYYLDSDEDGYGDPNVSIEKNKRPEGYVPDNTDCDDNNKEIHACCSEVERFTDRRDGTVRDNETGLIWLKDANAFGEMNWTDAKTAVAGLSSGEQGLSDGSVDGDWRLPTIDEWENFMCRGFEKPALVNANGDGQWTEGDAFTAVISHYYWADNDFSPEKAWHAYMRDGNTYIGYKVYSKYYYVWPVRNEN